MYSMMDNSPWDTLHLLIHLDREAIHHKDTLHRAMELLHQAILLKDLHLVTHLKDTQYRAILPKACPLECSQSLKDILSTITDKNGPTCFKDVAYYH